MFYDLSDSIDTFVIFDMLTYNSFDILHHEVIYAISREVTVYLRDVDNAEIKGQTSLSLVHCFFWWNESMFDDDFCGYLDDSPSFLMLVADRENLIVSMVSMESPWQPWLRCRSGSRGLPSITIHPKLFVLCRNAA